MDVEKFINLMFDQKCLWDQSDPSYHLRDIQRRAWSEVSKGMEISVDELKKRWRGLRDTFGKELKKLNNKKSGQAVPTEPDSKWTFFKNLLFLQNTMSRRDLKGNVADACLISDEDEYANESEISSYSQSPSPVLSSEQIDDQTPKTTKIFKSPLRKKSKRRETPGEIDDRLLQIEEEKLKCLQGNANDPDAHFLMSLLPFLKDNPKHRKLMVRTKIQQVLIEEQTAALSPVVFESSEDSTQYSVDFNMPQNNTTTIQGKSQEASDRPQILTEGVLSQYIMQFNPNIN